MEIQGPKIAQKCYTTTVCMQRTLLQHHHVETVPWGGKPATALCLTSVDQGRSMPGREENRMIGGAGGGLGITTQMPHSLKRRAKHAEVKLNSQTERKKNCPSLLPGCHSFPNLISLKSKSRSFPLSTHHPGQVLQLALLLPSLSTGIQV